MFAVFAVFLLCLMSVSLSAPPVCEKLVHPLATPVDPSHFEGPWALVAGSINHQPSMEGLRLRDSITLFFPNTSDTSKVYTQVYRFDDRCEHLRYNVSLEGSSFTIGISDGFTLNGALLSTTCPDCAVVRWVVQENRRKSTELYLLSRRREVAQEEMEEFKAQLKCYGLPTPVVMDPTKELCPKLPEGRPTGSSSSSD
ncbi:orm1 [Pungitius sinensis]